MFKIPMRFKKQAGYILLEGALALSIAAGVMTYYMAEEKNRFAEDMAKIHGQHMKAMAAATNAYITNNYGRLIAGTPIPIPGSTDDVAYPLAPTVQELMDLGLLPNSPGLANPVYGGGFTIRLTTNPVAGAVNGFVGTTAPVAPGGQVSSRTIGRALQEIGINGMATGLGGKPDNELRAQNQDNAVAGPDVKVAFAGVVAPQPGLMAVQVGTGVCNDGTGLACDVFLRRDGTRPMTGTLDMDGKDIGDTTTKRAGTVFTKDLEADKNITATKGDIEAKAGDVMAGQDIISRNGNIRADGTGPTNGNITANNNITSSNGNIRADGTTSTTGNITANNNITATTGNIEATAGDVTAGRDITSRNGNIRADGTGPANGNITANNNITATTGNITATTGDVTAGRDLIALRNLGTPETRVQKIYAKDLDLSGDIEAENITARNKLKTKDLEVTGEVTNTLNMGNGANLNMGENDIKDVKDIGEDSVLGRVANIFTNILNAVTAYIKDLYVSGKVMTNLVMNNTDITDANLVATKTLTASTAVDTNNLKVTGQVLAALNMGGNDITNAKDIGATGNISTTGNISATSPTSTVYTTDLSVAGKVITDLKLGSNPNNDMNKSIRNVQTVYAKYFHTEGTAGCDKGGDENCGGSIKTAHLKSVGNVDVHGNLYLGQPGSKQMRLGDIPGGTAYWTSSCPANTVMVGVHGCSFSGGGSGSGTAPEGGGSMTVSVSVSGDATCYAVCAPIAPAHVPDK